METCMERCGEELVKVTGVCVMPRPHLCCIKGRGRRAHTEKQPRKHAHTPTHTMLWILSLLFLVALQALHGSAEDVMPELQELQLLALSTTIKTDECVVNCTDIDDGVQVDDPLNCHTFYACYGDDAVGPLDCPEDEYFNGSVCIAEGSEECKPICGPGSGGNCAFECGTSGLVADRFDCSAYYDCANQNQIKICDAATPFFDGSVCQSDESKCCHCKPFCYTDDTGHKVMDPIDCTKYYLCTEDNKVPEFSGHCTAGNFDPFREECTIAAPCITLCTNVVNPEGCIDVFTCQEEGYFPACPSLCDPKYYHCTNQDIGSAVAADSCPDNNVFHPDTSQCVPPEECPYQAPWF